MCDYSLQNVVSRPAKVGDYAKLRYRDARIRSLGRCTSRSLHSPGNRIGIRQPVECRPAGLLGWLRKRLDHRTAIFRQINKERAAAHHDALEFPDGQLALLTSLEEGQEAVVLQLPTRANNASELEAERRVAYVG